MTSTLVTRKLPFTGLTNIYQEDLTEGNKEKIKKLLLPPNCFCGSSGNMFEHRKTTRPYSDIQGLWRSFWFVSTWLWEARGAGKRGGGRVRWLDCDVVPDKVVQRGHFLVEGLHVKILHSGKIIRENILKFANHQLYLPIFGNGDLLNIHLLQQFESYLSNIKSRYLFLYREYGYTDIYQIPR